MDNDTNKRIENLERQLNELVEWKRNKDIQQISYPLDEVSRTIIDRDTVTATTSNFVDLGSGSNLTIASGSVTPTEGFHDLDTEGAAATDDLDTIVDTGISSGSLLLLRAVSSSRTVVLKDGTGNLILAGDCTLDNRDDVILLMRTASGWYEISRSDNGA